MSFLLKNKKELLFLIVILTVGAFLRFYHLEQFANFLADQGRDAIIIKRIATFEHFTAIGAPTSIGHIFLGPFYYYFIAPWFWLFNFQPVGLVFGVSFFSTVYLCTNYFIIKELIGKKAALISTLLLAFSTTLIEFSRFSWNPNLLPFFAFLTYYFLYKGLKEKRLFLFLVFGFLLSFSIQLHYLALFLILPSVIYFLIHFFKDKKNYRFFIIAALFSLFTFILGSSPLIIFDLKHQFLNTKSFIAFFQSPDRIATNKLDNFLLTFNYLNKYVFNLTIPMIVTNLFLLIISIFILYKFILGKDKNYSQKSILIFFFFSLIGVSLYPGPKHAHYFSMVFPFYYIILSIFMALIAKKLLQKILITILLIGIIYLNVPGYRFLYADQLNQIYHAQKVAIFLDKQIGNQPFNFAVQPDSWQEDSYLYFLELKDKRPANREKQEVTDQMFVVCGDPCNLYTTPSWNVKMFGEFKIIQEWKVEGVKIYKLIHKNPKSEILNLK